MKRLVAVEGRLFAEVAQDYLIYVEPLADFLERTPAEKHRVIEAAIEERRSPPPPVKETVH